MKPREYCLDKILICLADNFNKPDNERIDLNANKLLEDFGLQPIGDNHELFKELIKDLVFYCSDIPNDYYNDVRRTMPTQSTKDYEHCTKITSGGYSFIKNGGYTKQKELTLAREVEEKAKETLTQELTASVIKANNSSIEINGFLKFSNRIW